MKKLLKIIKWGMLIALTVIVLAFTEKKQGEQLVQLNQIDIEILLWLNGNHNLFSK